MKAEADSMTFNFRQGYPMVNEISVKRYLKFV